MINQLGHAMENILKAINTELQLIADELREADISDRWEEMMMEMYHRESEMWSLAQDEEFLRGWEMV
jgi:hypothetical protein